VLYLFVPDYHAPEAVPASLLAAFNAEVSYLGWFVSTHVYNGR
jgi:hypothetical protein